MSSSSTHGVAAGAKSKRDKDVKMVLIGDANVGKTSLGHHMCFGKRPPKETAPTIAAGFFSIQVDGFRLVTWDTAGSDRFGSLMPMYVRDAAIILCVYDLGNPDTLERCRRDREKYMSEIHTAESAVWVLVGNKCDKYSYHCPADGERLATEWNARHFTVSAHKGEGINNLMHHLSVSLKARESIQPPPRKEEGDNFVKVGAEAIADMSLFARASRAVEPYRPSTPGCCGK